MTVVFYANTLLTYFRPVPEIAALFDESATLQRWLDVEVALAEAQARLGLIPHSAAAHIKAEAALSRMDVSAILSEIADVRHPLVPLLREFSRRCGAAGDFVHWGATTQDIVDTAMVLQMRDAIVIIEADLCRLIDALGEKASAHRTTLIAGRTHGQMALPTTFGLKLSVFVLELTRHLQRLRALSTRVFVGQLSGAVGTLAGFGPKALDVQRETLAQLRLAVPDGPWHTARDSIAEVICWLGMTGATLGKLAEQIVHLQATEFAELQEFFAAGCVGSSTMPHKRNPFRCESIAAIAVLLRDAVPTSLAAMNHRHERDGTAWDMELAVVPRAISLFATALRSSLDVVHHLVIKPERMRSNLENDGGFSLSEAVMLELARHVGREEAHAAVQRVVTQALATGTAFRDALIGDEHVARYLPASVVDQLLRADAYIGCAPTLVDRAVEKARLATRTLRITNAAVSENPTAEPSS